MSPADLIGQEGDKEPALTGRPLLRSQIFKALADRNLELAGLLATRLSRLSPPHADDLMVAAAVWANCNKRERALGLMTQALTVNPHHALAAKTLAGVVGEADGSLQEAVLNALCWHAETDPDAIKAMLTIVSMTKRPLAFVATRRVHCLLPPGEWLVVLQWRHLTLARFQLEACNEPQVITAALPGPLRGIVDPTVFVNGTELARGTLPTTWLAAPRLSAHVQVDAPSRWLVGAVDNACPDRPVALLLCDGDRVLSRHVTVPDGESSHLDLAEAPKLTIDLPQGAMRPHLIFELTGEPIAVPISAMPSADDGIVDVVVPVYGDFDATQACFAALLDNDPGTAMRIIAIDDAGPDERIGHLLDMLAAAGRVTLIRNPGNLGFVRSVNIGMARHHARDVVLLNADTIVSNGWLGRLRSAARRASNTGTITPWSNDATICSYPAANSPFSLSEVDVGAMDRLTAGNLAQRTMEIPTAVGFCMYIRRDCLAQTGWFDAETFGTGYGEENDFCLRATALGWQHLIALDVYVGHVGSASFSTSRHARIATALAVLEHRYPGYQARIHAFIADDPLRVPRRQLDLARLISTGGNYPLLIVCAKLGGGTDRFVADRLQSHADKAGGALVLRPMQLETGAPQLWLEVPKRPDLPNLIYDADTEVEILRDDLQRLGIVNVELHHPSQLPPDLLPVLASWFAYRVHVHDYSWICPRINLVNGNGRYCGEPVASQCDACVGAHGDLLGIDRPVAAWRDLTRRVLEAARGVDCSSHDTADRLRRYAPNAYFQVAPAEPPLSTTLPYPALSLQPDEVLRIVVPGAIGIPKGYQLLLDCARDIARRKLPLRFLVLGYTMDDDTLAATGQVMITGQYKEDEFPTLLAELRPHAAFLSSIWPETWCYALSHVMAAGLPVAAFALGAQAERLRRTGNSLLLPADMAAEAVNDALLAAFGRPSATQ